MKKKAKVNNMIEYMVKKEIKQVNMWECGKHYKYKKIKVGEKLKAEKFNGCLMIVTKKGKQVCRVNSMLFNEHIEKLVTIDFKED